MTLFAQEYRSLHIFEANRTLHIGTRTIRADCVNTSLHDGTDGIRVNTLIKTILLDRTELTHAFFFLRYYELVYL
jgi:hypothetical protein